MHFEGTVDIRAPREKVWGFLLDPHQVTQCAPGVDSLEILEPGKKFRVNVAVGLGTVKAKFSTDVEWLELEAPGRARAKAHGKAPGSAVEALAEMRLVDTGDGATTLQWQADANVMGTLASLAARMAASVAGKLTGQFFECVRKKVEA